MIYSIDIRPIATCTEDAIIDAEGHALVFGRCKVWVVNYKDKCANTWWWSKNTWWKAMWYPHRGKPSFSGSWGLYTGADSGVFSGPGDAELTHWAPMLPSPQAD